MSRAELFFRKAIEVEPEIAENHFNLACFLSNMGKLVEANAVFKNILEKLDPEMYECNFYLAVNYAVMDKLESASNYLQRYLHKDPEGDFAEEAEEFLLALEEENYDFNLNTFGKTEEEALLKVIKDYDNVRINELLCRDTDFNLLLKKGLWQGSDLLRESIIRELGVSKTRSAESYLLEFVVNPWVNERLRHVALSMLNNGFNTSCCRIYDRQVGFKMVTLREYEVPAPLWKSSWQKVLDFAYLRMQGRGYYSKEFYFDLEAIWLDYINSLYPDQRKISKPQIWSAALEYCLSRFHFLGFTQAGLAADYGVSLSSVQKKYAEMNRVLEIDQKAYQNLHDHFTVEKND